MAMIVGETAPYRALNGHTMVAPLVAGRMGGEPREISSWARCVDDCRACRGGGFLEDYCGEEW